MSIGQITYRGSLLPYLQSETWDFDPNRGYIHLLEFDGASQEQMLALQQDYARAGIACRLNYRRGGHADLHVEDSTLQYTIDKWELVGNNEGKDGLSQPNFINELYALALDPEKIIASMREHLENHDDPTQLFGPGGDFNGAPAIVERRYRMQLRGATEYRSAQYVLRHTTNAPGRWVRNIADFGVENIYSPAQLLTEALSSALWIFPIPPRLAYKIANFPAPPFQPGYMWGWLKGPSTETTAANNRIDIATEYTLEQWNTDDYLPY